MTVRTPVYVDGNGNLKEMSTAMITAIKNRCRYLYGTGPSSKMTVTTNGLGNLTVMTDSNMQAGASLTSVMAFPTEGQTAEPSVVSTTYDKLITSTDNTGASADTSSRAFPLYYTSGNLRSMSLTDVYDTFCKPAIVTLVNGTTQPGIYRIWNSNGALSGHTRVSTALVFRDKRANTAAYTAAGIPETLNQTTNINTYYLYVGNAGTAPAITMPAKFDGTNITANWAAAFDVILKNSMRHLASEVAGHRIRYNINGAGTNKGTSMVDTRLTGGSGTYSVRYVSKQDYRAQEFPNGTASTVSTYNLKVALT